MTKLELFVAGKLGNDDLQRSPSMFVGVILCSTSGFVLIYQRHMIVDLVVTKSQLGFVDVIVRIVWFNLVSLNMRHLLI
jgi:hypothetical protein